MEIFMPGDLDNLYRVDKYDQNEEEKQYIKEEILEEADFNCNCNCHCDEHKCSNDCRGEYMMKAKCPCSEGMYPESMYCEKKFKTALKMIKESIQGEKEDEMFYNYLIEKAPTKEEKDIIASIRDDEIKHNMMFKRIYSDFTGKDAYASMDYDYSMPKSYMEGIKKAFFGELKAMEKYRKIRESMPNRYYRDMLFEILTDEMKHGEYYNYIMTMNK